MSEILKKIYFKKNSNNINKLCKYLCVCIYVRQICYVNKLLEYK